MNKDDETGNLKLEIRNWELGTGYLMLDACYWKLETFVA